MPGLYARLFGPLALAMDFRARARPPRARPGCSSPEWFLSKRVPSSAFVIVDAAMNDLIRPALYEAWHGRSYPYANPAPGVVLAPRRTLLGQFARPATPLLSIVICRHSSEGDLLGFHRDGCVWGGHELDPTIVGCLFPEVLVSDHRF